MSKRLKKITAFIIAFVLVFTLIPRETYEVFATGKDIVVKDFKYKQVNTGGKTAVTAIIDGLNFEQEIGGEMKNVIKDISVGDISDSRTILRNGEGVNGVKVEELSGTVIKLTAPDDNPKYETLGINTNGESTIRITTIDGHTYEFKVQVNKLPTMSGSLDSKRKYVDGPVTINGLNFTGVTDVKIAGASHKVSSEATVDGYGKVIQIENLRKGTLAESESIAFIKENTTTGKIIAPTAGSPQPINVSFMAEYRDKIMVYEKLDRMDNLEVLPSEGPAKVSSKITVRARTYGTYPATPDPMEGVFNDNNTLHLRREVNGKEEELTLTDVKLVHKNPDDKTTPIVAIEGWTPVYNGDVPSKWDLIVKDKTNRYAEGIKENAFTFVTSNPAPQITGLSPTEGPDTGGTDVLITGKNIFNVNTPGLSRPNGIKIIPAGDATLKNINTLNVKYTQSGMGDITYGGKKVTGISRNIRVRIASMTNQKQGTVHQLDSPPKPGDKVGGKPYGKFHFMAGGGTTDGIVVTTTNASTSGPQDVILEMDTTFTFDDGTTITVPEATKYRPFIYVEKNPTPKVEGIDVEYGFFNDSAEESDPPTEFGQDTDGVKPIMIRIRGQKFEAIKTTSGTMLYPTVNFVLPDNTVLPAESSPAQVDTKVLDDNGNPIDGIYNKVGTTLVVSVIPKNGKYSLRALVADTVAQPGFVYKKLEGVIQVTNPSGNHNTAGADGVKFQFRRPVEGSTIDVNSKQPKITRVTANGAPVKKIASDADTPIEIRVKATAGITDLKQVRVTVDGLDISDKITSTAFEGEEAVINVTVPKGFAGKSRLQVIIPEGLMDSYNIIFDNIRGPEIKELIPPEGDLGTIVVIKRDTQANEVSFKEPIPDSKNIEEQKGSKVLWNGKDINELLNGYVKDGSGNIIPQTSEFFKGFKQPDEEHPADWIKTPGKYVYVVDSDTIYLKIPDGKGLKEGKYKIQIKNPDGSESTEAKIFTIIDTIDKTKIGTIIPDTDDIRGGLITTITADVDADGVQTNFKGGVDVYFGSQKAEVVGYDIDYKEVYVKVPPLVDFKFPEALSEKVWSYTVPVTVQNQVNKSTDTKTDGFIYLNPNYKIEITQIYNEKYSTDPTNPEAKKGVEGDYVIIRGKNFRLQTDADGNYILPKVMFGYILAETPVAFGAKNVKEDGSPRTDAEGRAELEWIKVKVPKRPIIGIGEDGSIDVLVQNPDGAKDIAEKGFIYKMSAPTINEKASILQASRFHDTISVSAKEVNREGLVVAFGNRIYEKELSASPMEIETTKEIEKIVVKFIPNAANNIEVYYKSPDGKLTLMTDAEGLNGGKGRIGAIGDKLIFGINWKNPAYHSTDIRKNPNLIATLNTEYVEISTRNKAPNLNTLMVRRSLGKVTGFSYDNTTAESKIIIETPYNEKVEKTTITLINSDGSSATAPFIFHGGMGAPRIDDIEGSKERELRIDGKPTKSKVFTNDYTAGADITVIGANFKDVERVMVGDMDVEVLNISPDYTKMRIRVPKGNIELVGKPLAITVVTKSGNGYSNLSKPPVFYMYIQAGSKPILTDINPKKGPQTGGTKVILNGAGFNELDEFGVKGDIEVYFLGKKAKVTKLLRNDKGDIVGIEAITPAVEMIDEESDVYVKNADEGKSEPLPFQYISQPVVERVEGTFKLNAEKLEDSEDIVVTVIGKNFYDPETVVLGGKLIKVDKNKDKLENQMMLGVKANGENQYVELEKNKQGQDRGIAIKEITQDQPTEAVNNKNKNQNKNQNNNQKNNTKVPKNTTSFKVTMPIITFDQMQSMTSKNIIVIDGDGGTSPEAPVDVKLPIPDAPVIIATPGSYNSINLSWSYKPQDPNRATRFEVFIKEGGKGDYVHVGNLEGSFDKTDYSYVVKDLKPDTKYQVKVRVMNKFGEAEDFGYATITTLKPEDDPKQKEKISEMKEMQTIVRQNGVQKTVGDQLQYTVGTLEKNIDLSRYKNSKKQVRIPASYIKLAPESSIRITDNNMSMNVPLSAFTLNQVAESSDHAVVAIDIVTGDNKQNTLVTRAVPNNKLRAGEVYNIGFKLIEPKKTLPINFTNSPINLTLGSNSGNAALAKYNTKTGKIEQNINSNIKDGGYYVLLKNK